MQRLEAEFAELAARPGEIEKITQTALEYWNNTFDYGQFQTYLKRYRELVKDPQVAQDLRLGVIDGDALVLFRTFKEIRKAAMFLRTSYRFFDVSHDAPERLETFNHLLGQFNDRFSRPQAAEQYLVIMDGFLKLNEGLGTFTIKPGSFEGALDYSQLQMNELRRLINQSKYRAGEFHYLRKKLRLYTNIFTLVRKYRGDGNIREIRDALSQINDELGHINDEMVTAELRGDRAYHDNEVTPPPELQAKIRNIVLGGTDGE